ncbi:MAG: hypothetical protein VZR73_06790 [Acutalibacteraceae bacterium]|nr:hypothetical protein [Acutalibacteraceae bacterium]
MAYFAPYIDGSGLHMPTYEDRLAALVESYQSIFGIDSELSPSVPDYQLLSVVARALDDTSALVLNAFNSRNPAYATGESLDLLLPQYGLTRAEGETDAQARARISSALADGSSTMEESIVAAVKNVANVTKVKLHVNDGDATDAQGVPAHTLALLVVGGNVSSIAPVLFAKKNPGIGTYGNLSRTVTDAFGSTHTVRLARPVTYAANVLIAGKYYTGFDEAAVKAILSPILVDYITNKQEIGESLVVPSIYGVCYAALGEYATTLCITDVQVAANTTTSRERINLAWNEKLNLVESGITYTFTAG